MIEILSASTGILWRGWIFLSHFSSQAQEITVQFTSALNPVEIKFDTVVKMKKENC